MERSRIVSTNLTKQIQIIIKPKKMKKLFLLFGLFLLTLASCSTDSDIIEDDIVEEPVIIEQICECDISVLSEGVVYWGFALRMPCNDTELNFFDTTKEYTILSKECKIIN